MESVNLVSVVEVQAEYSEVFPLVMNSVVNLAPFLGALESAGVEEAELQSGAQEV